MCWVGGGGPMFISQERKLKWEAAVLGTFFLFSLLDRWTLGEEGKIG